MWIFQNDSFLSVVEHRDQPGMLLVRSRVEGDIQKVFPAVEVFQIGDADYRYRAIVSRDDLKAALAAAVDGIDYPNFKNSIAKEDVKRKQAYLSVWTAMANVFGAFGRGED